MRVVVSGVGAAGHAIIALLHAQGATDIVGCGRGGAVHQGQENLDPARQWIADHTNREPLRRLAQARPWPAQTSSSAYRRRTCSLATTSPRWPSNAIVFALANPDPEVDPVAAGRHAAVVATGRSDYPNQINNVLAFPGFFRGMLDSGTHDITEAVMLAAASAIADAVSPSELNASYIVPSVFDPRVAIAVADAVREAATSH